MKHSITHLSTQKAALVVAMAFIISVFIVTYIDDFVLANFVVPGNTEALARDMEAKSNRFPIAVIGYLLVLVLDAIIGLALYVVLKPANKNLASLTASLRLLYAFTLTVALLALAFQGIDVYDYASIKLMGYLFFAVHIFVLGYTIFKSSYLPKGLGLLLVAAAFSYTIFFVEVQLPDILEALIMLLMAVAELSFSIWLLVQRKRLPAYGS